MQKTFVFLAVVALVLTCAAGAFAWVDNFESGLGNWTQATANGGNPVSLSTTQSQSATHSVTGTNDANGTTSFPNNSMQRANDNGGSLNNETFSASFFLSSATLAQSNSSFSFGEFILAKNDWLASNPGFKNWDDDGDRTGGCIAVRWGLASGTDPMLQFKTNKVLDAGSSYTKYTQAQLQSVFGVSPLDTWITVNIAFGTGGSYAATMTANNTTVNIGTGGTYVQGGSGWSQNGTGTVMSGWTAQNIMIEGAPAFGHSPGVFVDDVSTGGVVPEPSSMLALMTGLLGLVGLKRRFTK